MCLAKVKSYVTQLKMANSYKTISFFTPEKYNIGKSPVWHCTQTGMSWAFTLKASLIPDEEHELTQTRASTVSAEEKLEIVEFYNRPEIRVVIHDRMQTKMGQERGFLNRTVK